MVAGEDMSELLNWYSVVVTVAVNACKEVFETLRLLRLTDYSERDLSSYRNGSAGKYFKSPASMEDRSFLI